ncbi:sugar transferase [Sphingomonas aerolata]|uniref:sugar transferase n=1 Tax=Sphingomonas aerolata TaxID=185951 RepID=UPI00335FBA27
MITSNSRPYAEISHQLIVSLLSSVIPYIIISLSLPAGQGAWPLLVTAAASFFAVLIGSSILRNVTRYPGVETSLYFVPSFSIAYASLLLIFAMARIPYSRPQIIGSFVCAVIFYYVAIVGSMRHEKPCIAVVPVGDYQPLLSEKYANWHILSSPDTPLSGAIAVAANLWADLPDEWERRLADFALQGIPVYHSKHLVESLTGRVELEHLSENTFGTLSPISAYMALKRVIDTVMALIMLTLLFPLLLILMVVIRFNSPGPAIFRQERMGHRGEPFTLYKFRTMTNAPPSKDQRDSAMTKEGDNRITSIGHFLRHSRIDELPQLVNVLKGEMSWIGPRPEAMILSRWYEQEIPFYRYRHIVRPGITGWAQVSQGHVVEVSDVTSKLHYDFYYIKNYSLWIDILIVIRTIRTMMTGFGAK